MSVVHLAVLLIWPRLSSEERTKTNLALHLMLLQRGIADQVLR
jgi:hypothetical protein